MSGVRVALSPAQQRVVVQRVVVKRVVEWVAEWWVVVKLVG